MMNSEEKTAILSAAELAASFVVMIAVVWLLSCCLNRWMITTPLPDRPITTTAVAEQGDTVEVRVVAKLEEIGAGGAGPCSVCLADYGASDVVRVLPGCGHVFHRTCVDSWLRLRLTCPLCRNEPHAAVSSALGRVLVLAAPPPG